LKKNPEPLRPDKSEILKVFIVCFVELDTHSLPMTVTILMVSL